MRFRNIFHLVEDAQEISALFDGVSTKDQMVSALERLKQQFPSEFLDVVQSLRLSADAVLEDTLEVGGTVGGDPEDLELEDGEVGDVLGELSKGDESLPPENQITDAQAVAKK